VAARRTPAQKVLSDVSSHDASRSHSHSDSDEARRSSLPSSRLSASRSFRHTWVHMLSMNTRQTVTQNAMRITSRLSTSAKLSRDDLCFDDVVRERRKQTLAQMNAKSRFVLLPGSRFIAFWRTWMVGIIWWTAFMSPFELAFSWWSPPLWYTVVSKLIDVFCWSDMLLSFFTANIQHGKVVMDFKHRTMPYLKTWFVVDFLTNFPWDLVFSGAGKGRKLGKVMKLPKVFRMMRLLRAAREEAYYFGVVFTIVMLVLLVHCCSCCWVALIADCKDALLVLLPDTGEGPECPPMFDVYAQGLSVGLATLSGSDRSVRFGPGSEEGMGEAAAAMAVFAWGSSPWEEVVAVAWYVVSCALVAVLFGRVLQSIQQCDVHTRSFHERLHNLKAAETQYGMDSELHRRVRRHYHYLWVCGSDAARTVLKDEALSVGLRRRLALSFYGTLLRKVPFLTSVGDSLLRQLCECVDLVCFARDDYLVTAGEYRSDLCFLVVGQLQIEAPNSSTVLQTLVEGSFFGEMNLLFPESCHRVNIVAVTDGWLLTVGRRDLEQICSEELLSSFKAVAFERYQRERRSHMPHLEPQTPATQCRSPVLAESQGHGCEAGAERARPGRPSEGLHEGAEKRLAAIEQLVRELSLTMAPGAPHACSCEGRGHSSTLAVPPGR